MGVAVNKNTACSDGRKRKERKWEIGREGEGGRERWIQG